MKTQKSTSILFHVCLVLVFVIAFASCGKSPEQKVEEPAAAPAAVPEQVQETVVAAAISELLSDPVRFENKEVRIEGVITHVCRKNGDKMMVQQDGSEQAIRVMLGEFIGQITPDNEGSRVIVTGLLKSESVDPAEAAEHEGEHEAQTEGSQKMEEGQAVPEQKTAETPQAENAAPVTRWVIMLKSFELVQPE